MARGRRFEGRVQTPDLAAPEPIRPGPIKRDTYERAQKPVVDTSDSQRLVRSLGIAKSLVGPLMSAAGKAHADARKSKYEHDLRRWNHFLATTETNDQLDIIYAGKAPSSADPIFNSVVQKHIGHLEALRVAKQAQSKIDSGEWKLGTYQFNSEKAVIDLAAPIANKLGKSKDAIYAFRKAMDGIRRDIAGRQQKAIGEAHKAQATNIIYSKLKEAVFKAAVAPPNDQDIIEQSTAGKLPKRTSPEVIMDGIREGYYRDLGPRVNGGTFGGSTHFKYGDIDKIFLDVLHEAADNPHTARLARELLHTLRFEILHPKERGKRKPQNLGRLSDVHAHRAKVNTVTNLANKTIFEDDKERFKARVNQHNGLMLGVGRGVFFEDQTHTDPATGKSYTYSKSDQQDALLSEMQKVKQVDPTQYYQLLLKNNLKPDKEIHRLDTAVNGWIMTAKDDPKLLTETIAQRAGEVEELAKTWAQIDGTNELATEAWFGKNTNKFFEAYHAAREDGKNNAGAIQYAINVLSNKDGATKKITDADQKAFWAKNKNNLGSQFWDFVPETIGGSRNVTGEPSNFGQFQRAVQEKADRHMRVTGVGPDQAMSWALSKFGPRTVRVNNRLIFDNPSLISSDRKYFEAALSVFYRKYEEQLKRQGVESPSDLTVLHRNGNFEVMSSDGSQVVVIDPHDQDRVEAAASGETDVTTEGRRAYPKSFPLALIVGARTAEQKKLAEKATKEGMDYRRKNSRGRPVTQEDKEALNQVPRGQ